MGLGQVDDVDALKSDSSRGGGSGNGSSSYPKFQDRIPQISITCDEDGEWNYHTYPEGPAIEYIKEDSNSAWEHHYTPSRVERYWMERVDFLNLVRKVEQRFEENLWEVLKANPERALELIVEAAKVKSDASYSKSRSCAVCDCEIDLTHGDYKEINRRVVCTRHNVEELHSAGLLD